eukprot:5947709-Alexandrium_andersonii.AAC.1
MSASLVGSEMCIRDRSRPEGWRGRGPEAMRGLQGARAPRCQVVRVPAVSYTHLTLPTICSV